MRVRFFFSRAAMVLTRHMTRSSEPVRQDLPSVTTLSQSFTAALPVVTVEHAWSAARSTPPALATPALAQARVDTAGLLAAVPPAWLQCCGRARPLTTVPLARRAAEAELLSRLTLVASSRAGDPRRRLRLSSVPPVRMLTALQADEGASDRCPRVAEYLRDAGAPPQFGVPQFVRRQAVLWRVPWENERKETLWRLALDGVPFYGAQRFRPAGEDPLPCWCGAGFVARRHLFWHCAVARSVCASITAALRPLYAPAHYSVRRAQVWLAEPPPGVPPPVWHVVSLAALDSVHHGQRLLAARCLAARPAGQPVAADDRAVPAPLRAAALRHACTAAVARFWSLLEDFASLNTRPPAGWPTQGLPPGHPFFGVLPGGSGRLQATGPPPHAAAEMAVASVLGPAPPADAPVPASPVEDASGD